MQNRRTFLGMAASAAPLAVLGSPVLAARPLTAGKPASFRARALHLMDVARVPGLAFATIRNGRIATSGTLGDRSPGKRATESTRFDAASLTKAAFATVVLALARQGFIDLNRPLQSYVPLFGDPRTQRITASHVLSHTTGLPNWYFDTEKPIRSEFEPGTRWAYSGEGYFYLLEVAEKLTGKPLARLMAEHVFEPAGMTESAIVWSPAVARNYAAAHDNGGDPIESKFTTDSYGRAGEEYARKIGLPMERWTTRIALDAVVAKQEKRVPGNAYPSPAYGLWTTAGDYARFLAYAAKDSARWSPQVRMRGALGWGRGWGLELGRTGPYAWHGGNAEGIKNMFVFHRTTRNGIVVFTNGENGARVYEPLIRDFFSADFDAFLWM
jgi:CubicO group peptidase (beta-lactamase class C family)